LTSGERALYFAFGLMVVFCSLASSWTIEETLPNSTLVGKVAIFAGTSWMLFIALCILLSTARPWMVYSAALVLMSAQVISDLSIVDPLRLPPYWWGTQITMALGVLVAGVLLRGAALRTLVCILLGFAAIRLLGPASPDWAVALNDFVLFAALASMALFAFPVWRSGVVCAQCGRGRADHGQLRIGPVWTGSSVVP
jgi:hypothetical protein